MTYVVIHIILIYNACNRFITHYLELKLDIMKNLYIYIYTQYLKIICIYINSLHFLQTYIFSNIWYIKQHSYSLITVISDNDSYITNDNDININLCNIT